MLRHDGACWEEWKTVNELEKLAQKYPGRYQKTASGHWRCPPGEAHASQFGLKYCVRTDAELNPIFTQNLMFLSDYLGFKSNLTTDVTQSVLAYLVDGYNSSVKQKRVMVAVMSGYYHAHISKGIANQNRLQIQVNY
ncbi:hypothetical protein LC653_31320 [Nostoc sp. CHAB 5784]|uniref:hypothetical protein n=1 Tax=Nostoc mirabile TaxID=2907820 RepID=UPI001E43D966|nr:hypothetical protein [Nostoc mirabile]MCC5668233.1 hypothetical protein [Nostoc mirabile CHAB5784]